MQLINGEYAPNDPERFRELYNALLIDGGYNRPDPYFILKDFRSYADAQKRVEEAYRDEKRWAKKMCIRDSNGTELLDRSCFTCSCNRRTDVLW